jgi:two-component system phosphate regulon sensor histidine kinase PhoR
MRLGIRFKLFVASIALVAVSFVVADAYLSRATEAQVTELVRSDAFVRAALAAREAQATTAPADDRATWDAVADGVGRAAGARVTYISRDGTVLGDSEVDLEKLASVENHATRPEVARALAGANGDDTRSSFTVQRPFLYVAVPVSGAGAAAVARIATPLAKVDDAVGRARMGILYASALALGIAILLSSIASQRMTQVVQELTSAARKMATGDLAARTHVRGADELGELAASLDQLAGGLSQTLEALRAERDLMARILEGMEEGVLVLDRSERIVLVNGALRTMLLLGHDAHGKLLLEAIRHAELEEVLAHARDTAGVTHAEVDLPGLQPRRLLVHAAALAGDAGGLLAVCVDVTDLRRLESLRRDFVANVSHELRTPVTALLSATETLRGAALRDPNAAGRFLDIIERNARRLQDLIEDLLELSRLDAHQYKLRHEKVDVPALFGIVVGLFRERAEKKGVRIATRTADDLPVLESDPRALEQVLVNLVDNAVKYCPSGAQVTLSAEKNDGAVRFAVEDTGPGIDAKHLPRLFERFYRVDAGRSRELGGTGLGLSIVKHLVEAMGGDVGVESTVGRGTTFRIEVRGASKVSEGRAPTA